LKLTIDLTSLVDVELVQLRDALLSVEAGE
jgi:hypothetical protein